MMAGDLEFAGRHFQFVCGVDHLQRQHDALAGQPGHPTGRHPAQDGHVRVLERPQGRNLEWNLVEFGGHRIDQSFQ